MQADSCVILDLCTVCRPTVAGIHGGPEGAYSIALSGNYEDNIDIGHCFTYTGEGGRDLKGTKANPKVGSDSQTFEVIVLISIMLSKKKLILGC